MSQGRSSFDFNGWLSLQWQLQLLQGLGKARGDGQYLEMFGEGNIILQ